MAVATSPEPLLKSTPDVNKLNAFNNPIVTVTRHKAARGTPGFSVVASLPMKLPEILSLQTTLPVTYGAGYYKFSVADTAGGETESWMVALGKPDEMEVSPMPSPPGFPPAGASATPPFTAAPLDPETKQIMPGWFYNESTGLLMTPWREAVQWRQGEPLPKPPAPAAGTTAPHLSLVPPNANPWSWPAPQSSWGTGWGNYPVNSGESDEMKLLKDRLAASERKAELDQIRADNERRAEEQRRRDDERERREEQRAQQTAMMFEKLAAALTAKPSGPSSEEQRLQREADESRRRAEEMERRHAEERREDQRREEARIAEERRREDARLADERHREEMRVLREASASKADPLMSLFSTILSTQSTNAQETARMIRDTSAATTAAAERSTAQILDLARAQKDSASESSKTVLEGMKGLMEMQTGVYNQLLDVAGQSGQPAWVGLASDAMQKIGAIGQALAERNQQQVAQPQYTPPPPRPMQRQTRQQTVQVQQGPAQGQMPVAIPRQQVPAANAARPGYVDTGGRPEGTTFDPKTEEFILADGMRIKQSVVEKEGWVVAVKEAIRARGMQQGQQVQEAAVHADGLNGAAPAVNGAAGPSNVTPLPVNKSRKKKGAAAPPPPPEEQEEEAPAAAMPPPANGQGYTVAEIRDADSELLFDMLKAFDDATLFGDLWQFVPQLRASTDPQQIVQYILQGHSYLRNSGKTAPAMDLLDGEQLGVFVARLLPEAPEPLHKAVVDKLAEAMGLTANGADA